MPCAPFSRSRTEAFFTIRAWVSSLCSLEYRIGGPIRCLRSYNNTRRHGKLLLLFCYFVCTRPASGIAFSTRLDKGGALAGLWYNSSQRSTDREASMQMLNPFCGVDRDPRSV